MCSDLSQCFQAPYLQLLEAFHGRRYQKAYALMRTMTDGLPAGLIMPLCEEALNCTPKAFDTLLAICPDPQEYALTFTRDSRPGLPQAARDLTASLGRDYSLLAAAAFLDRPRHLSLLLEREADPNCGTGCAVSALEAAVLGQSPDCVGLLLGHTFTSPLIRPEVAEHAPDTLAVRLCLNMIEDCEEWRAANDCLW